MRIIEVLAEGTEFVDMILIHETTPEAAEKIKLRGFKPSQTGIFFNRQGTSYTGGGYGGVKIAAHIFGKKNEILDLSDDNWPEDLDEFAEGEEIARYARNKGYWAWMDDLQMAILDPSHIKIPPTQPGLDESASGYIPSEKEKNDPRFKTALTVDVKPDSIKKNAKAFGFNVSRTGIPPLLRK